MSKNLLMISDLAEKFKFSVGHIKQQIIKLEGFPDPIRFSHRGDPRWIEADIDTFIENQRNNSY